MSDCDALLDKALDLGRQELQCLGGGEFEEAGVLALERAGLISSAWKLRSETGSEQLLAKLMELRNIQGMLTVEARRLHAELKGKIQRAKQEGVRFAGYGKTVAGGMYKTSHYISKRG